MAAEPRSSLSYRTTGSTCLHPLSELLGIPLDQVTAGGRPGRALGRERRHPPRAGAGGKPGEARRGMLSTSVPAPMQISLLQTRQVEFCLFELMFFSCTYGGGGGIPCTADSNKLCFGLV